MFFYGREKELSVLENMYQKDNFQMLVMYGRRRVGKTTLLSRFSSDKNPLFFTGIESKDNENLRAFGNTVFSHFNPGTVGIDFRSYADLFSYLTSQVRQDSPSKRHLIIIDEYPYMAGNSRELSSLLQKEIDHAWKDLNIMLILCGSSISFMEDEVLGEKSPLFGRRTGQIDLLPLDYLTASLFVEAYTPEEKAIIYGITGGIPKYLSIIDPSVSLEDNIISLFCNPSGYLYEEPKDLLRQEFRDVSLYFAILNAIGTGKVQVAEIAGRTGFDTAKVSQALRKLEAVRIIKKQIPILNEKNKKLTQYVFCDGMFRFWFRFIPGGISAIERNYGDRYFNEAVKPYLHDYMGEIFETICQEYTFQAGMTGKYGNFMTNIGKWRGNDPIKKCPADIDVVGINEMDKTAVIGECKFKNTAFGKEEYDTLLDRSRLIQPYKVIRYLIFSLSGVTKWVEEHKGNSVGIITMEQLFFREEADFLH